MKLNQYDGKIELEERNTKGNQLLGRTHQAARQEIGQGY